MNVEGEGILLSEMRVSGMIENCGWFSRLIRRVVSVAVATVAMVAVGALTVGLAVATAGVVAPALIAAGVGLSTTVATGIGAIAGAVAGKIFLNTIGKSLIESGVAFAEAVGEGVEIIIEKATKMIKALTFDGLEYMLKLATVASVACLKNTDDIVLGVLGQDNNVYLTPVPVTHMVAVAFMRVKINSLVQSLVVKEVGCYTYWENKAKQIAIDASDPFDPNATNEYYKPHYHKPHTSKNPPIIPTNKLFFPHWHPAFSNNHAWFGIPVIE